jgi:hypothetical protein
MTWEVEWRTAARQELLDLGSVADDPDQFAQAAEDLERALAHDPDYLGESRAGNLRLVFHRPFQVLFSVDLADAVVTVRRIR